MFADSLRAGNLLLRAHLIGKRAQDVLSSERDSRARAVVEKFQWITAATVFTNPIPARDLMATGAISGPEHGSEGSLLELWNGERFLADGDEIVLRARGGEVELGEVRGRVVAGTQR